MCSISKELMELEIKVERKIGIMGRFAEYEKEWGLEDSFNSSKKYIEELRDIAAKGITKIEQSLKSMKSGGVPKDMEYIVDYGEILLDVLKHIKEVAERKLEELGTMDKEESPKQKAN